MKVLKDALADAEHERDRVQAQTVDDIRKGQEAQARLDAAQAEVDELIEAIDRLERPEQFSAETFDQNYDRQLAELPEGMSVERPDIEERTVAGVGITRRKVAG